MANLKQLLLDCQVYMQEGDWDRLTEALNSIREEHFENLDFETVQECMRILEHLMKKGEEARNRLAENLVNFRRFREGYGL